MTMDQAPSLFPEPIEAVAPPGRGKHGYYRKLNGWICVGPTTPSNRADFEYKGFTFLPQYGEFANGTNEARAQAKAVDDRGNPWNPAVEQWRLIFQRGGAKEFPIDQIIAFRWHLRPPYREVAFPQLDGVAIINYPCPECEKGVFASTNQREAAEQLRAHLTCGVNQRHSYTPTDLRELGKELGINFESARVGRMQEIRPLEPEHAAELTSAERLPCERDGCDYLTPESSKNPKASLMMHERHHHKEAVPA